jgi:hypothetical protein
MCTRFHKSFLSPRNWAILMCLVALFGVHPDVAHAQHGQTESADQTPGSPDARMSRLSRATSIHAWSAGVLVGRISGLTIKARLFEEEASTFPGPRQSMDVNLSTNFDDYALWSAHVLTERMLPDSPLTAYIGPGLTAEIDEKDVFWGFSGTLGVLFNRGKYEIFLQVMPRLYIMPDLDGKIEAATGLRFYF